MVRSRKWLSALLVALGIICVAFVMQLSPTGAKERGPKGNHWRHYDGRWNYWDQADNRWYYTDGSNWYYNDGKKWDLYRFDKDFGRKDFERGDYKAPGGGVEIKLPRHKIYVGT